MELIISTVVCIALLIVLNICAKKGTRLPAKPLIHLVLLGLAVAAAIMLLTVFVSDWDSTLLTGLLGLNSTNFFYMLIDNFILTALMEEGLKYLVVRLYLRKKDCIKCTYQGIVAVSAVAAGFVVAENIVYILGDSGLILRITFGLFGHFVYAVFMGTDISKAMVATDASTKRKLYLRALFLPTLLHGAYDLALSVLELDMDPFLYILLLLHILGAFVFFYVIATIKKIRGAVREMKALCKEAYFAGGCFWCITPIYKMYGVDKVICGYAGGDEENPTYEQVKHQKTGHRETIKLVYDPERVAYEKLLDIYFANVDPFDGEGQFIDKGFSYTLAIFYTSEDEKKLAEERIASLEKESNKKARVALLPYKNFYEAEEYHQDYYLKNPEAFEKELIESGRKQAD